MWFSSSQSWVPMIPLLSSIVGILMTYTGFYGQSWIPILTVMASDIGIILTLSYPLLSTQNYSKSHQWKIGNCQSWLLLLMLPVMTFGIGMYLTQGVVYQSWIPVLLVPLIAFGAGMFVTLIGFGTQSWTPMLLSMAFRVKICLTQIHIKSQLWKKGSCKACWLHMLPIITVVTIGMYLSLLGFGCQSWMTVLLLPSFGTGILVTLFGFGTQSWTPMLLSLAFRIQGHMKSQLWKIGNSKVWLHLLPILTVVTFGIGMFLILIGFGTKSWIPMSMLTFGIGILLALIGSATKSLKKTSIQSRGKNQWQKIRPQKLSTTCFIWKNKTRVGTCSFLCNFFFKVHTKHISVLLHCRSFSYFNFIVAFYYQWSMQPLLTEMVKLNHCYC